MYLSGNAHPVPHAIEILERSIRKLPSGIQEIRMRVDSAFCDPSLADYLQGIRAFYAIVARITGPKEKRGRASSPVSFAEIPI